MTARRRSAASGDSRSAGRPAIRCIVADDHPAMVTAIADTLAGAGFTVEGRARDGLEASELIAATTPDVAVVDIRMPHVGGIEIARRAGKSSPGTSVVLYTAYGDRALLMEALDAGARGFVLKEAPLADLVRAVEQTARGGTYVDPILVGVLAGAVADSSSPELSRRERDVLRLLADGHSNEEVGKALYISPETVRTHVRRAMAKLEADTRTQAVAIALRRSLIS